LQPPCSESGYGGPGHAAADAATAAVEHDGYDEASLRVLLRAYVAGGRAAAALAAYARARERLADDLGTDPSPETVALYTAILRGELPSPPPAPARDGTGVVGRDEELAYLDTVALRARDGPTEIVVVGGEAGALAAADAASRSRCLAVGGRTRHAAGDLAQAELLLGEAFSLAGGIDRVTAAAWLGVLRAHQSRTDEALALLRPAARAREGVAHTAATLHALLFTGHAHAVAGRPALALDAFTRYTAEAERRQVPRFSGRAVNFAGWVLRNLGAADQAHDRHLQALELGQHGEGIPELAIAALEDLAEQCVEGGDPDGAQARLAEARALLTGDLVFGWRLDLKHHLVSGRVALLRGDAAVALAAASALETRAAALGVPRYLSVARVLKHRANRALTLPVDLDAVAADLDRL
jgi:hypothetical protein